MRSVVSDAITAAIMRRFISPSLRILPSHAREYKQMRAARAAEKEIKTSRSQSVMLDFNLFVVIVQTCSTRFDTCGGGTGG